MDQDRALQIETSRRGFLLHAGEGFVIVTLTGGCRDRRADVETVEGSGRDQWLAICL